VLLILLASDIFSHHLHNKVDQMENETTAKGNTQGNLSKILVVDDEDMVVAFYEAILAHQYEVHSAKSGEEALEVYTMIMPDLILLDVEMPGINGYDTCRALRQFSVAPIVFATAHQSMDEQLKAYDAGGDDLLSKPLNPEILLRKVALVIQNKHTQEKLIQEKSSLHNMAMNFLSSIGESGVLLTFARASLTCRNYEDLAQKLVDAIRDFGLEGSIAIRHGGDTTVMTTHGEKTALESAILEKSSTMGRIFQFKRNLVVNYDKISILIPNMTENDDEKNGRIRDNIAIIAEAAEAFCENVDMRQVSMARAESMQIALFEATKTVESIRDKQSQLLMDVRVLLHGLTDKVESSYSFLGTTQSQEKTISSAMNDSVQRILEVLAVGNQINEQFASVVSTLKGSEKQGDIDLF
jgi:CheY-like chemotaxis protein